MSNPQEKKATVGELSASIRFGEGTSEKLREIAKTANRLADQLAELEIVPSVTTRVSC